MNDLLSILFYLAVFSFSAILVYLGSVKKAKRWLFHLPVGKSVIVNPCIVLGLVVPMVAGAVRYGIGFDYASYLEIYQYFADGNVVEWHVEYIRSIEPLFQWLAYLSYALTGAPLLYFAIPWIATVILVYRSIVNWTQGVDRERLAFAWFFVLPIISAIGFNQIRQMLAIAIVLYATKYLFKFSHKNILMYILLIALAMLSHQSAVIAGLSILIVRLFINRKTRQSNTGYAVLKVAFVSISLVTLSGVAILVSGATLPYADEMTRLLFVGSTQGVPSNVVDIRPENLILMVIFLPAVFTYRWYVKKIDLIKARLVFAYSIIGLIITILSVFLMNGERLAQYFVIFPVIAYYLTISTTFHIGRALYPFITFLLIVVTGWQGMFPYYSIYSKDVDLNAINSLSVRPLYSKVLCNMNVIKCVNMTHFDNVVRERYEFDDSYLWKLRR